MLNADMCNGVPIPIARPKALRSRCPDEQGTSGLLLVGRGYSAVLVDDCGRNREATMISRLRDPFVRQHDVVGSFCLPVTGLSDDCIPSSTWPSTSGCESSGNGKRTP